MAAQKQVAQAKPGVSVVADASRGVARAAGIIARVARRDDEWERIDFLEAVYWTRQARTERARERFVCQAAQ